MKITYKTRKPEKVCTNASVARKMYGERMARLISQRITEIQVADSIEILVKGHIGRCHLLTEDRKGQYAMDLVHPYRLVFTIKEREVEIAHIIEIVDYHN